MLPITVETGAPAATSTGTGSLPATGSNVRQALGIGLGLVAFGGAILWAVRRERTADEVNA